MNIEKYLDDKKRTGNILVLAQTEFAKATFVQNVAKNNIKDISWVTKIMLSKERERPLRSCFNVLMFF